MTLNLFLVSNTISIAIAEAFHGAGVLHQDLSVSNVMLTEDRSNGVRRSGVLNDWDRAQRIGSLSIDHRIVRPCLIPAYVF